MGIVNIFSDISIWWSFPILIGATLISALFYRNQKQIEGVSKITRLILITLRATSLFLILIFLLGIILENKEYKTEKPILITLVDNSSSMLNYKDSLLVKSRISEFQRDLREKFQDKFDFQEINVDSDVYFDTLTFSGIESDLEQGFSHIYNQYYNRNIGGICFISDGNFNKGNNPLYTAEKINLTPIFSIGVGDTVVKKDQLIRNVSVNNIAFLKNKFPIEIDIEAHKMGQTSSKVSIWSNGKRVAEEAIDYSDGDIDFNHVSFDIEAQKIGFVEFEVRVEAKEDESTLVNNRHRFYVEIIDSRNKILILANSPHPDLTAIKQVLEKDENADIELKLTDDWKGSVGSFELIILQNPKQSNSALIEEINLANVPVLYLLGNSTSASVVNQLKIGLNFPSGSQTDEVQGGINSSFQLFETSTDLSDGVKSWPPLSVKFGKTVANTGDVLIHQQIGPVKKTDPLLMFGKRNSVKYGAFLAEGLWKWKLSEFIQKKENQGFDELIQKTVQYLTVKRNTDPLRVILPKRYTTNSDVVINAEFYNSSFEKINGPDVSFELRNENNELINYEFARFNASYILSLGTLSAGKYSWIAKTNFARKSHKKSGIFIVDDISLEAIETHANHNILNQIATKTNGSFYRLNNLKPLFDTIENRSDIVNVSYEESVFEELIDWKSLFLLLFVLLGVEWFIRRYNGSY